MCKTKNYRKTPRPKRSYCYSCNIKRYKERHPERYAYRVLKNNALRRGKPFTISFEYFLKFAVKTNYMAGKGITKHSLHVDRIKEHLGYVEGNLQVLTNTENVKKYLSYQHDKNGKPYKFKIKKSVVFNDEQTQF